MDDSGQVVRFREKPTDPQADVAAICVYFLPPGTKELVDRYLASGGNPDAPGYFIEWLVGQTAVATTPIAGRWFDIGSLETLEAARRALSG